MNLLHFLVPIAEAASLTTKSTETAAQSEEAVTSFLSFLWDRLDNWAAAIIVVVFAFYFAKMVKRLVVDRVADKMGDEHEEVLVLVGRATYVVVLAVGLTIGLKVGGIDLTVIVASVGFGIGFALQDIIMNFFSGVMILAARQFAIGDFIEVNGTLGKVQEIQSRATILQALDGTKIIVPNSDLFTNQVISYTTNPFRRIEIPVGVEYRTDLKKATNVMLGVLHHHAKVLKEPSPAVVLDEFSDSSINFKVRFWVQSKDKWIDIKSEIIEQLKIALDEAGINIPFPIRTLVFDKANEKTVIPTYSMTQEEIKQHKMEQIQAQSDQAQKDAANTHLQAEYARGDSHTEHVDLEDIAESAVSNEQEAAEVDSEQMTVNSEDVATEQTSEVATEPIPAPSPAPQPEMKQWDITTQPTSVVNSGQTTVDSGNQPIAKTETSSEPQDVDGSSFLR